MSVVGENSSSELPKSPEEKPVILRVKRKALRSPLDAFWLEINERPVKRPLLDFEKLSMSDSSGKAEELKTKKVLVRHVETVSSFDTSIDVVKLFVDPNCDDMLDSKLKSEEREHKFKKENQKQDQLLSKARQKHEVLAKNARFEQIWRSRKGNQETSHEKLRELCDVYDVIRVDVEERQDEVSLEDQRMLNSYLPLLREFIPDAASEIESDLCASSSKQASENEYVYDLYAVNMDMANEDASNPFPLVQVDDEEFYDGPDDSEYETDDSNAENNPHNDYPDEISEEEEEESESEASDDGSEENDSSSNKSSEPKDVEDIELLDDDGSEENDSSSNKSSEPKDLDDDMYDLKGEGGSFDYNIDGRDDGEDQKWSYR